MFIFLDEIDIDGNSYNIFPGISVELDEDRDDEEGVVYFIGEVGEFGIFLCGCSYELVREDLIEQLRHIWRKIVIDEEVKLSKGARQ